MRDSYARPNRLFATCSERATICFAAKTAQRVGMTLARIPPTPEIELAVPVMGAMKVEATSKKRGMKPSATKIMTACAHTAPKRLM